MSDVRTPASRAEHTISPARSAPTRSASARVDSAPAQLPPRADSSFQDVPRRIDSWFEAVAEFSAPPTQVAAWLANPMLSHALREVSADLAPEGVARDAKARYAASVVETHLAARKALAKHLNALLRA